MTQSKYTLFILLSLAVGLYSTSGFVGLHSTPEVACSVPYNCEIKCTCHSQQEDTTEKLVANCTKMKEIDLSNLTNLPSNITELIISNSDFPILKFSFLPTNFENLRLISFQNCNIIYIKIEEEALEFATIQHILIQNNAIDIVRAGTFRHFPNVQNISLDDNSIEQVYANAFSHLHSLRLVNLSYNQISKIETGSFKNLPNLEDLDLLHNDQLTTFPCEDISELPSLKPLISDQELCDNRKENFYYTKIQGVINFFLKIFTNELWVLRPILVIVVMVCLILVPIYIKNVHRDPYITAIGQIKFNPDKTFGPRKNVFKGMLKDGRPAAVKLFHKQNRRFRKELDILLHMSQANPNQHVIQYLCKEEDDKHLYIALELCHGNLEEAILKLDIITHFTVNTCLQQLTDGLRHVHRNGIQHRDIKPSNILWKQTRGEIVFVISDFDIGHFQGKPSENNKEYGTEGWAAPELWDGGERTTAVNIFSLGCVFHYVLTGGQHPFGSQDDEEKCQQSICDRKISPSLVGIKMDMEHKTILAKNLIALMIQPDAAKRPKAKWVLQHPLFWSDTRVKDFYHDIGDRAVDKKSDESEHLQVALRANSAEVFQGSWGTSLDETVMTVINKKYDTKDICMLLREIRNKIQHILEYNSEIQSIFHNSKEGVAQYFNEQFPRLLQYTFNRHEEWKSQMGQLQKLQ